MINPKKYFCLNGFVPFSIEGSGALYDYISYQYSYFRDAQRIDFPYQRLIALQFFEKQDFILDIFLKESNGYFAKSDKQFIWAIANNQLVLDGTIGLIEQQKLLFNQKFNKMKANLICELIWRLRFMKHDIILVHAACVSSENSAYLIPAWKGIGKTTVCLKLVKSGYEYMSDDRIWLGASGEIYAYPRYVVLKDSNAFYFPEFTTRFIKIKLCVRDFLNKIDLISGKRLIRYLINKLVSIPVQYHHIEDLYPTAKTRKQAQVAKVIYLTKNKNSKDVAIKNLSAKTVTSHIYGIDNAEWNASLLSFAAAHDVLFPDGPQWSEDILNLIKKEKEVLSTALKNASCFELTLPIDKQLINWNQLTNKISRL